MFANVNIPGLEGRPEEPSAAPQESQAGRMLLGNELAMPRPNAVVDRRPTSTSVAISQLSSIDGANEEEAEQDWTRDQPDHKHPDEADGPAANPVIRTSESLRMNRILHHQIKDESLERTRTQILQMKTRKESDSDIIHETDEIGSNDEDLSSDPKSLNHHKVD